MKRSRTAALFGSALFLIVAPGTVAGLLPWLIGGWRFEDDFGSSPVLGVAGALLILLGLAALLESFARFAWKGLGTPAPIAPTERLIVSGQYRHARNPMYVAVLSMIAGQALLFGQAELLAYAAAVWLAFHLFIISHEEPTLSRRFPGEYEQYRRGVRRWVPRLAPWKGPWQAGDS